MGLDNTHPFRMQLTAAHTICFRTHKQLQLLGNQLERRAVEQDEEEEEEEECHLGLQRSVLSLLHTSLKMDHFLRN
jgi:hypothetical protein